MKAILLSLFVGLLMGGCGESTPEIEDKPSSLVADAEEVVGWVLDNYSSMEDGFAGAENDLRSSDAPAIKILDDLAKLVSDRRIQSEDKKKKLIALKEQLEGKKVEIEKEMTAADSSMRDSYDLALEKIEGKLDGKIKPLLDFDFQYLEKFERDLNASTLEWKRYLRISDGVLDEGLIRNELANRISAHFRDNMAKLIEERREKWEKKDTSGTEQSEKEQANGELVHTRFSFGGNELQMEKESKDSDPSLRETYENAPPEIVGEPEAMEVEDKQVTIIKRSKERMEQRDKTKGEKDKIPEIRLVHNDWGSGNQADVLAVLRSTARQLFPYAERYDWNPINVGRSSDGPIVLFRRGDLGEYLVNLNTRDRYWAQYAFQFAQGIGHILCGFKEGDQSNHWFEEMLCETASLFALRKLSQEWKRTPPHPNWKSYAGSFYEYAQERIDQQPWSKDLSLSDWYAREKDLLVENANDWDQNLMVANRILPFFEKNPAGWAACFALNKKKGKEKRSFETYLRDWYESCDKDEHREFVQEIAKAFGFKFPNSVP